MRRTTAALGTLTTAAALTLTAAPADAADGVIYLLYGNSIVREHQDPRGCYHVPHAVDGIDNRTDKSVVLSLNACDEPIDALDTVTPGERDFVLTGVESAHVID
ncbi:hypothetical protein [Nocardiopsis lucentensis]|uniref:hypothetical protein n=1 Tax=Nocardiopsis lucentensis TaxID=53441 RepID=UPI0003457CF5|nr:hypothetical protein [Nocardiopsis lucentensis]